MTTSCRFSTCQWTGSVDEIFTHCETHHPRSICEHKNKNYYDFTFDNLKDEAFLLNGKDGLYWFCLDLKKEVVNGVEVLKRGIFHIGQSVPIVYTLKLGSVRERHAEYLGDFTSRSEEVEQKNEIYDLEFAFTFLEFMEEVMPSRKMRLYVGEFDDSDDVYVPESDEVEWTESDEAVNKLCLERFTCSICLEYIRRNTRFCENQHFVCVNCFEQMLQKSKLKCPVCRVDYSYDCHDPEIESLLKMVKFPASEEDRDVMEQDSSTKRAKID